MMPDNPALLHVNGLSVDYTTGSGMRKRVDTVIQDVGFEIGVGETLALVGESGSGKSTIGKAILGLTPVAAGSMVFRGRELVGMARRERRSLAAQLQVIFQNPYGSLNPAISIGRTLAEPLQAAGRSRGEAISAITELLDLVGMPSDTISRYPGDFSGGQRQRIAIARALVLKPALVVCDEPTSALDVSTQASVLELLAGLQRELNVSYLFITHDLAVVRRFADRAMVLEAGRIVEHGTTAQICESPEHPYTRKLVAAAPVPDPVLQRERRALRLESREAASASVV
jgi:peptide/nickel transport system ATP-binding protein